jgi:transposase InsO family protein
LIGFLKVIQSDSGKEFIAEAIKQMIKRLGIKHKLSNPYNPLGNSVNEKYIGFAK